MLDITFNATEAVEVPEGDNVKAIKLINEISTNMARSCALASYLYMVQHSDNLDVVKIVYSFTGLSPEISMTDTATVYRVLNLTIHEHA